MRYSGICFCPPIICQFYSRLDISVVNKLATSQAAQVWDAIYKTLYESLILSVNCLKMVQNIKIKDELPHCCCVLMRSGAFQVIFEF